MTDVAQRMEAALAETRESVAAPWLVARLTLTGDTPLAARLRRDDDLALSEARQAGESVGGVLIDKVALAFEHAFEAGGHGACRRA